MGNIVPDLRKNIPTPKADSIVCYGCKSDTVFVDCSKCLIRKCAKTGMQVESCVQCTKFPCVRLRIHGLTRRLMQRRRPHLKSIPANRACIQNKGITARLSEQEERWKCPKCATAFTWYGKACASCGNDLDFKTRFSGQLLTKGIHMAVEEKAVLLD
jgi:hypothetical protein